MTPWQKWVYRPQSLLARRMLFQIHLWTGIGIGIYVAVISISGSAIVYRQHLHRSVVVAGRGRARMRIEAVAEGARRAYPAYQVLGVTEPPYSGQPDVVVLERGGKRVARLFDPYSGTDLGDPQSRMDHVFAWLADLHDNLLSGLTGRMLNGIGALLLTLLSAIGAVLWWPGIKNWRRSMTVHRKARFARLNWDLHSAVGFWFFLFVLIWGVSGILLCFPGTLDFLIGGELRTWVTRLHYGQFNRTTEVLWTVVGLAPGVLAGTGALMWWNRVLSKKIRRFCNRKPATVSNAVRWVGS